MKLRNLIMAVIAGVALLTGCNKEVDLGPAKLQVNPVDLSFEEGVSSQEITLTATRDWAVTGLPGWIALSKESGAANADEQTIVLSVTENKSNNRSATLTFSIGFDRASVTVSQRGPDGEVDNGDGSLENPFTVAGAVAYVQELGKDVESPRKVFVKGIISSVETSFEASDTYGNATFDMVDEIGSQVSFKVFQTYYLGGVKWTKSNDNPDVQEEDEVIIYGTIYNYKGTTPETTGKGTSFIYSLNGVNRGGVDPNADTEEQADETLAPASDSNIAGLVAKIDKNSSSSSKSSYSGITLAGATVTYVNGGNVYLEDNSGAVLLYMQNSGLVAGDVLSGPVSGEGYYYNGLPEIVSLGEAYTKVAGTAPAPAEMTIEKLVSTYTSQLSRYIILKNVTVTEGMESRKAVVSQGDYSINVYAGLKEGLILEKDATGDIIVFPTLYNTTKQVSFWDNSHFSGNGGDEPVTPPTPGENNGLTPETAFTASEANAWVMANIEGNNDTGGTKYYVKGIIQRFYQRDNLDQNFTNNSYHQATFYITDDGKEASDKEFEAYQINYLDGATFDPSTGTDVKVGDEVVIYGPLARYNTVAETAGKGAAYLYSLNAEGGDTPGGDTELGVMESNVGFEAGTNGYTDSKINVTYNGTTYPDVANIKLGKSSAYGAGTITIPAGTTQLNFFAVGWKGADASVKFTVDGKEYTLDVTANDGATGSGTLELAVSDADKYSISLPAALAAETQAKVETYSGNKSGYRAFVFAVHALKGEGGGENPGDDTPGDDTPTKPVNEGTLESPFTVADALIAAKDADLTGKEYYVKAVVGKDIAIKNGVASFELMDGTTEGKLTVVKAKSFKGAAFDGTEPLDWLDEVVLKGTVTEYSTLPALTEGELVKWNGKTTFKDPETDLSKIIALEKNADAYFEGLVSAVTTKSFVVTDGTNNVYVYQPATMAAIGDKVTVTGTAGSYNGLFQINKSAEVEVVSGGNTVTYPDAVDITTDFDTYTDTKNAFVKVVAGVTVAEGKVTVAVEGATAALQVTDAPDALGLAALDGKKAVITGYYGGSYTKNSVTTKYIFAAKVAEYAPATSAWTLKNLSQLADGDIAVIVSIKDNDMFAMSNDKGTGAAPAAVAFTEDDNPADNIQWTVSVSDSKYSFTASDNNKLYCTNSNNGVRVGTNANNTFVIDAASGYLKNEATERYLGVYDKADWRCYNNTTGNTAGQTFKAYVKNK